MIKAIGLAAALAANAAAAASSSGEAAFNARRAAYAAALTSGNLAAVRGFLLPGSTYVMASGTPLDAEGFLRQMRGRSVSKLGGISTLFFGNSAVAYRVGALGPGGPTFVTEFWVLKSGDWYLAWRQATPVLPTRKAPARAPANKP